MPKKTPVNLTAQLEIFDRLYAEYYNSDGAKPLPTLLLYLLRHNCISRRQIYMLLYNLSTSTVTIYIPRYIKDGYIKPREVSGITYYYLTPMGRRTAVAEYADIASRFSSPALLTRYGHVDLTPNEISESVSESLAVVKGQLHHSTSIRDEYISLLKSSVPFTFWPETPVSYGTPLTPDEKHIAADPGRVRQYNLWTDGVYVVKPTSDADRRELYVEQDCGTERMTVIRDKLLFYINDLLYPSQNADIIKKTLILSVGYPGQVTTNTYSTSDRRILKELSMYAAAIAPFLPETKEPDMQIGKLKALMGESPELSRLGKFLNNMIDLYGNECTIAELKDNLRLDVGTIRSREALVRPLTIRRVAEEPEIGNQLKSCYEKGFSFVICKNSDLEELTKLVFAEGGRAIAEVFAEYVLKQDSGDVIPLGPYTFSTPDGRRTTFPNHFSIGGESCCVENVDADLGGGERGKQHLYESADTNNMTLLLHCQKRNKDAVLARIAELGKPIPGRKTWLLVSDSGKIKEIHKIN